MATTDLPQENIVNKEDNKMTLLGHLLELRKRVFYSAIAMVVTIAVSFIFANQLFEILKAPAAATGITFVYIDVTEMIGIYMKVCVVAGFVLASPFLLYQFVMFVAPGLKPNEKKYVQIVLPWVGLMFIGGVVFGYYIFLPPALKFLLTFANDIATPSIRISNYVDVITRFLLAAGLIFELPVFCTFLAKIGIVTSKWLAGKRKWAIILAFVASALITPTPDPINQTIVAIPMIVLYEISIWLAWFVQRGKRKAAAQQAK
jgi:sec-independent protein translocase protein TatC